MEAGAYPAGGSTEPDGTVTTEIPSVGPAEAAGGGSSAGPAYPADTSNDAFAERPEAFVGAAFVGGLVVAQILKRLGR
jgi:hypothetical protein